MMVSSRSGPYIKENMGYNRVFTTTVMNQLFLGPRRPHYKAIYMCISES